MINPLPEGTQPLVAYLVVKNCAKAIEFYKKVFLAEEVMRMHGPKMMKPMADAFWGDRMGTVMDPFGHNWTLMMRKEELSHDEIMKRSKKAMAAMA
jgi:uncharacterized glyoxalase superfamily protein PhnB